MSHSWTGDSMVSVRVVARQQAFTLVELLVVIVVIAILVALLVPTIGAAMYAARNAQIGIEISNLAQAIEAYRTKNGSYPPDFASTDPAVIKQQIDAHLARNYRYRNIAMDQLTAEQLSSLDPSEALYFWIRGLSKDPKRPLTGGGDRVGYDFKQAQLADNDGDGFPEYYVRNCEVPLVYIHNQSYGAVGQPANILQILNGRFAIRAYAAEVGADGVSVARFVDPEKYQVICAGQDSEYGTNGSIQPVYPDALGYTEADEDNLTSFSEGKTLEDATP